MKERLHHFALVAAVREADTVALPIGPRPLGLLRQAQARHVRKQRRITRRHPPTPFEDLRQPLELHASHGRLEVGQTVVEAKRLVSFEHDI